jgi:transmembrane sensor
MMRGANGDGHHGMSEISDVAPTLPLAPQVVQQAARWMARLWSDDASAADHAACAHWRKQAPEHERAWQRLQVMEQKLSAVPDPAARNALKATSTRTQLKRRKVLQMLGLVIATGGATQLLRRSDAWLQFSADYSSPIGEITEVELPDGTRVVLNTGSAIDVDYTADARRILLRTGEVLITSAADNVPQHRPLSVHDQHGAVYALGTRFMVRQQAQRSEVAVLQGAVEIHPRRRADVVLRLDAGSRSDFSEDEVGAVTGTDENAVAWSRGVLLAEQMPVQDFVAELARYRSGMLRCDQAIAGMKVSGVFSLRDTDRALQNLTLGLPLQIRYRTRYWVTVEAR